MNEKRFIINNEKRNNKKSECSYKSSLINKREYTALMKYNRKMFNTTHSHIEKNFLNALDKTCFLKKIRMTNDESYRKIKTKKYGLRLGLLLLVFLLVLMIPILDLSFTYGGEKNGLLGVLGLLSVTFNGKDSNFIGGDIEVSGLIAKWFDLKQMHFIEIETSVSILFYCVPFFILAIILILGVVYYYKNSIKKQKITFKKTFYE
ncbi:Plasmodium exported protein (Pm-fam-a like), unknown function [Plasmodium malariae]|uniref:Fam-l protein n=1 Tax=Plasmodium malariae TaxID=5858 RepID=A0A1A8WW42_PLAMA|nr:Plasmodium exported protein (Pm-fam-a like), unknown function [Plasmodium malariae]